jgi:hypothetical protein
MFRLWFEEAFLLYICQFVPSQLAEGKQKILQAGFNGYAPPFTFRSNRYSLTFLVDGNNKIFGLTLESLD